MSHQFCVCAFCSLRVSCRRSNTRLRPNVGLLLAHRLCRWANISSALGYSVVFDTTLNVGSVTDSGPTYQLLFKAYYSQHEVGLLSTVEWILASTGEAGPTLVRCRLALPDPQPSKHESLNQCWFYAGPVQQTVGQNWTTIGSTSRVCWKGWQATFVFCTSSGVKILKLLPNWLSLKTI